MFGPEDVLLILVLALLFFGPDKLPELARSLGKTAGEFRKAQQQAEFARRLDYEDKAQAINQTRDNQLQTNVSKVKDNSNKIRNFAIEMGINIEDKTDTQIIDELRTRIKSYHTGGLK